ncbi:hypothetical protein EI94DRAFT_1800073 [Lactarius quietus]|nr:hypothetical protein EI94DRAFT_1800073 [Lactarius quietus]
MAVQGLAVGPPQHPAYKIPSTKTRATGFTLSVWLLLSAPITILGPMVDLKPVIFETSREAHHYRPAGEGYHGGYARAGDYSGSYGVESHKSELSQQSTIRNLPWSTANEDFVELFETPRTGQVDLAEILFDGTRSKGAGVVQFAQVAEAETAIGTWLSSNYMYSGRPLGVRFNDRWPTFSPTLVKGKQSRIQANGM